MAWCGAWCGGESNREGGWCITLQLERIHQSSNFFINFTVNLLHNIPPLNQSLRKKKSRYTLIMKLKTNTKL